MLGHTNDLVGLINRLVMDLLTPLLKHISPSVQYYFSGFDCEGGHYDGSDPHGHLHVVKNGQMRLDLPGGRCLQIDTPSVLLLPRPCAHTMIPDASGVELVCGTIDLGLAEQSPLALSMPEFLVIPIAEMPSIAPTLQLIYGEAFDESMGRQPAIDRLLEYFVIQVLRFLVSQGRLSQGTLAVMADPRLARALNAMHERPSHPWTLEQLADIANVSRARFAANFHRLAGVTPLDYLTNWRLSVARTLLRQGRSLKSAASAVGYQSPEAFGRVFAKRMGKTPTEWMRAME